MMKRIVFCCVLLLAVVGCSNQPSEGAVQTAIAETQIAKEAPVSELNNSEELPTATENSIPDTPTPKPKVSCKDDEVESYLEELDYIVEEWNDTQKRAQTTSRMSLSPVIGELQDIRRRTRRLEYPECGEYLNDLMVVAMDRTIDSFIAFLGQESDNIVARYMTTSEEAWNVVLAEVDSFSSDAIEAYDKSTITAKSLLESLDAPVTFELPDGWGDHDIPGSELVVSAPNNWDVSYIGSDKMIIHMEQVDEPMAVNFVIMGEDEYTDSESDFGRLFYLRTVTQNQDFETYMEIDSYYDIYAQNKGYVVLYDAKETDGDIKREHIWSIIITPDEDIVFGIIFTEDYEFSESDLLLLDIFFSSIRKTSNND